MASKLFNVLNKIEQGRQTIITKANQRGYELEDDASFDMIANVFNQIPTTTNQDYIYPDDSMSWEDDPLIYKTPVGFPDICDILGQAEEEGTYIPIMAAVLDNSLETTVFTCERAAQDAGEISIYSYQYSSSSNAFHFKIITSDGAEINYGGNPINVRTYTHTWDTTKDINGLYRWFVVYIDRMKADGVTEHTWGEWSGSQGNTRVGLLNALAYAYYIFPGEVDQTTSVSQLSHYGSSNRIKEAAITRELYFLTPPASKPNLLQLYNDGQASRNISLGGVSSSVIDTDVPNIKALAKIVNKTTRHIRMEYKFNVSVLDARGTTDWSNMGPVSPHRLYRNGFAKYYVPASNGTSSYQDWPQTINDVSGIYVEYDVDWQPTQLGDATGTDGRYISFYNFMNNNPYIPNSVTKLCGGSLAWAYPNTVSKSLPNITDLVGTYQLLHCGLKELYLDNVVHKTGILGANYSIEKLSMNGLLTFSDNSAFGALREVHLENCTEIHTLFGYTTTQNLGRVYANKCTISDISSFNLPCLRILVLGEGFQSNLNLTNCRFLLKSCIVDLFNKLEDYSEDADTHMIQLAPSVYDKLTSEEIAIATNKGWVIQ